MNTFKAIAFASALTCMAATPLWAQQNVNVRGTLTSFDGKTLSIKVPDNRMVDVDLPEKVGVAVTMPFSLADVKPGMMLGVTTVSRLGKIVAIDVRPIPPAAKPGLSPYDLQPQSTMTNAVLEAKAAAAGGDELTLDYKSGKVTVLVPPGTPMSRAAPGARSDLKTGETIYVAARRNGDKLVAVRVQVGKNGLKPTQ